MYKLFCYTFFKYQKDIYNSISCTKITLSHKRNWLNTYELSHFINWSAHPLPVIGISPRCWFKMIIIVSAFEAGMWHFRRTSRRYWTIVVMEFAAITTLSIATRRDPEVFMFGLDKKEMELQKTEYNPLYHL